MKTEEKSRYQNLILQAKCVLNPKPQYNYTRISTLCLKSYWVIMINFGGLVKALSKLEKLVDFG